MIPFHAEWSNFDATSISTCSFSQVSQQSRKFGLDFALGRGVAVATLADGRSAAETMTSSSLSPSSLFDVISALRTMGCVCARERITIDGHTYTVREQIAEG